MDYEDYQKRAVYTYVKGFDQYLEPGIPAGSVCLVHGGPGTLKTSFTFTILYNNMKLNNMNGLYVSLEQSKESLINNMAKLGLDDIDHDSLEIADYGTLRLMLKKELDKKEKEQNNSNGNESMNRNEPGKINTSIFSDTNIEINWLNDIQKLIIDRVEFGDLDLVVIDSLNGLYALTEFENPRKELFHFFGFLREINVTSFLIVETQPTLPILSGYGVEQFLSDGIIELGINEDHKLMRYIQIKKLRGTPHDMNKYAFDVKKGLRVWGKVIDSKLTGS